MNKLTIEGLAELRAILRALPTELTAEGTTIVVDTAHEAAADIRSAYPVRVTGLNPGPKNRKWFRPGTLRARVTVTHGSGGQYGAAATVRNSAPHAKLFERGTQARHSDLGANRGSMPPGRVFGPRMKAHRAVMMERLADMVERHGLTVTGR